MKKKRPTIKKLPKYKKGGWLNDFGDWVMNVLRADADIALSGLDMNNVVTNDMYRGSSANAFRNISSTLGEVNKAVAPMAATAIGGPMAGAGVSAAQAIGSNINPEEEIKYDQYGNPIIDPNKQQGQMIGQLAGQVLPAAMQFAKHGGMLSMPKYAQGGVYPMDGIPNAELENQEAYMTPNGVTEQVNFPSHAQGGGDISAPPRTEILSDSKSLKLPSTGKTPAISFKPFQKIKDQVDKIRSKNDYLDPTSRASLDNKEMVANFKFKSLYGEQEQLKEDKVTAYAKTVGYTLPQPNQQQLPVARMGGKYPTGGVVPTDPTSIYGPNGYTPLSPSDSTYITNNLQKPGMDINKWNYNVVDNSAKRGNVDDQMYRTNISTGAKTMVPQGAWNKPVDIMMYKEQMNRAAKAQGQPAPYNEVFWQGAQLPTQQMGGQLPKYRWGGPNGDQWIPDASDNVEDPELNTSLFGQNNSQNYLYNQQRPSPFGFTPMEQMPGRQMEVPSTPDQLSTYTIPNSNQPVLPTNKNYNPEMLAGANALLQNSGNIWDLAQTRFGTKYDKEDSGQLTPQLLNPKLVDATESIRDANRQATASRESLKGMVGGNAGAFMANNTQIGAQNALNIARIRQDNENTNTGILNRANEGNVGTGNAFMQHNQSTRMLDKSNEQQNKARSEDIARQAIKGIGTNTSSAIKDYKAGKMDEKTAGMIGSMFKNYKLDMNNKDHWDWIFKNVVNKEGKTV